MHEWVEQQQQQQRAGAWEAAPATSRPACPGPTSTGGPPSRGWRTSPRSGTAWPPGFHLGTARKAKPPAQAGEGREGAEAPPGDRAGGGGSAAGVRYLLAGAHARHAQAQACAGQMSAVSTGLRMAMMASGQQADVDIVAPTPLG